MSDTLPDVTTRAPREPTPPSTNQRVPRVRVIARRGLADPSRVGKALHNAEDFDLTPWVTRVRTTKAMASPAGQFEIGLAFDRLTAAEQRSLQLVLQPDNLLLIDFDRGLPESSLTRVMEGWISVVGEQTAISGDRVRREITVCGQDAGKFLVRHELPGHLFTAFIQGDPEAIKRASGGIVFGGTPGDCLRKIFQQVFGVFVPSPRVVVDRVTLRMHPDIEGRETPGRSSDALLSYRRASSIYQEHGKFWSLFQSFTDRPWNHAYADYLSAADLQGEYADYTRTLASETAQRTDRGGFSIIVRPMPFGRAPWTALPTTTVWDSEILAEHYARSDGERVNLVMVQPQGNLAGLDVYAAAIMYRTALYRRQSAARHGIQPFMAATSYTDLDGRAHSDPERMGAAAAGSGDVFDALAGRARRLWDWYSINAELASGGLVCAGNPALKIGQKLAHQRQPSARFDVTEGVRREFFIEQVVQDYVEGSHYRTQVALTRGQPLDGFIAAEEPERPGVPT